MAWFQSRFMINDIKFALFNTDSLKIIFLIMRKLPGMEVLLSHALYLSRGNQEKRKVILPNDTLMGNCCRVLT